MIQIAVCIHQSFSTLCSCCVFQLMPFLIEFINLISSKCVRQIMDEFCHYLNLAKIDINYNNKNKNEQDRENENGDVIDKDASNIHNESSKDGLCEVASTTIQFLMKMEHEKKRGQPCVDNTMFHVTATCAKQGNYIYNLYVLHILHTLKFIKMII